MSTYPCTVGEISPDADALVSILAGTPAVTFGTSYVSGTASTFLRTDDTIKYPIALMSSLSSDTVTLTDDGVGNDTLTNSGAGEFSIVSSVGGVVISPGNNFCTLAPYNTTFVPPTGVTILGFAAQTSQIPYDADSVTTGVDASVIWDSGATYTSQTHIGMQSQVYEDGANSTKFTGSTLRAVNAILSVINSFTVAGNTWTERTGANIAMTIPGTSGAGGVTVTNQYGLRIPAWASVGTAGTYTNAYGAQINIPTCGATIRRGIHVASSTVSFGTASSNTEGVYVEDITIGTARRANFYAEGATTGTPTDVYALYQGTAHVVGTNRYGARMTGATTGTPTTCYGYYSDSHSVGTNRWSYWGSNKFHCDASDFIANASGFGFSNRDSQSSSAGGGGTARYWRMMVDASATGVSGDVILAIDSTGVITATRAGGAAGTVLLKLVDVGTAAVTT